MSFRTADEAGAATRLAAAALVAAALLAAGLLAGAAPARAQDLSPGGSSWIPNTGADHGPPAWTRVTSLPRAERGIEHQELRQRQARRDRRHRLLDRPQRPPSRSEPRLAAPYGPGGRPLPLEAAVGAQPTVQLLRTGFTAAEPTLGITKTGTVFFVGFGVSGVQHSLVIRSRDGGHTWEETNPITPIEGDTTSFDPYIHVDPDTGRVFNADLSLVACSAVSTSDDDGEAWNAGQICQHTDHQNLFTGPPVDSPTVGYPNVVYYCAIDGGAFFNFGTFTGCSKSLDGGRTFVRTGDAPFTEDPRRTGGHYGVQGHCGGNVGHGTVGRDGTVYLPRGWCDRPYLAISGDEGLTWKRVQVADMGMAVGQFLEEHEASVAVDRDGNLYYAWIATDRLPYLVTSTDGAKTWSAPRMMAAPGVNEAWNVTLDVGDPGRIAFSYIGTTNSPGGPFCVRTTSSSCVTADGRGPRPPADYRNAKTAWHGYLGMTVNALDPEPTFWSTTVNDPARPFMRAEPCGPNRCDIQLDFLDTDVAPDGTAWAAYVDADCEPAPDGPCAVPGSSGGQGVVGHLFGGIPLVGPIPPGALGPGSGGGAPGQPPAQPLRPPPSRAGGASRCLSRSLRIGSRGIGRIRVGQRRAQVVRRAGARGTRRRSSLRYCVQRGGRVSVVFSRRGRAELVVTTARGHRARRGVAPRGRAGRLRRVYRPRRVVRRGRYVVVPSKRLVFAVRRGRIRWAAVVDRRLIRSPRLLRGRLRRAGV